MESTSSAVVQTVVENAIQIPGYLKYLAWYLVGSGLVLNFLVLHNLLRMWEKRKSR